MDFWRGREIYRSKEANSATAATIRTKCVFHPNPIPNSNLGQEKIFYIFPPYNWIFKTCTSVRSAMTAIALWNFA